MVPLVGVMVKMTTTSLEETVEFFCRNQIPILPCHGISSDGSCTCKKGASCPSPGKHPLMFRWQLIASCDKDVVMSWIGTGTKPINLAIRTGVKNTSNGKYLVGTDLDLIDHPMKQRLERYSTTVTQQSGSGGDHAFYWSRLPVRNSVELVDEKMDIRGSGGIMVIAPSRHKSGNQYKITCDLRTTDIQDLPDFLEQRLRFAVAKKKQQPAEVPVRATAAPSQVVGFWNDKSINSIRSAMMEGLKIPVGARNTTMHRLLSSDRARGVPSGIKLLAKAKEYLSNFEDPDSLVDELDGIVKSVMRYPAYNNSHEKVNELYLGWLGKNGFKKEHDLNTLEAFDKRFFDSLEACSTIEDGIPLKEISEKRASFMKEAGLAKFATYRPQLLAKKLMSLGIQRKRTSKGNNWLVGFKQELKLKPMAPACDPNRMEALTMSNGPETMEEPSKKKGLKDGDIIDHQGRKVRVELIQTQVKNTTHPREHLYQGKTGYDYNKAMTGLLPKLSEEQMEKLEANTLMMDLDKTKSWVSSLVVGDTIGIVSKVYQVAPKTKGSPIDSISVYRLVGSPGKYEKLSDDIEEISWFEIDHARELELLDILWRDGKPYGIPETRDMTVVLLHDLEEPKGKKKKKAK